MNRYSFIQLKYASIENWDWCVKYISTAQEINPHHFKKPWDNLCNLLIDSTFKNSPSRILVEPNEYEIELDWHINNKMDPFQWVYPYAFICVVFTNKKTTLKVSRQLQKNNNRHYGTRNVPSLNVSEQWIMSRLNNITIGNCCSFNHTWIVMELDNPETNIEEIVDGLLE